MYENKKKGEWPDNYLLKKVTIMELFYVVASSSKRILSLVIQDYLSSINVTNNVMLQGVPYSFPVWLTEGNFLALRLQVLLLNNVDAFL